VEKVRAVAQRCMDEGKGLIPLLQAVQAECEYLPPEALRTVAETVGVPLSQVYSVATFYHSFRLKPKGKHTCLVCLGTACHVRGGERVAEEFSRQLGLRPGETTEDGEVTLETAACLGACALAPLVMVDGEYHARMTPQRVKRLARQVRGGEEADE